MIWSTAHGARPLACSRTFVVLCFAAALIGGARPGQAADARPASMRVAYEVTFNGFTVGGLEFAAQAEQQTYTLSANAHLSLLLGAFTWEGQTRSGGLLAREETRPVHYSFDFKSNLKSGSLRMGFSDGSVTKLTHVPLPPPNPDAIPLREDHLQGVIDPLSALLILSRASLANPCERRLSLFDGRERFDLLFSYKGDLKVAEQLPSGQPPIAVLCRVRYLPIAGHKVDAETRFMAANEEIEVALRPIPAAKVYVPYQMSIPTMLGIVSIVAKRVEIASPGQPEIALLH